MFLPFWQRMVTLSGGATAEDGKREYKKTKTKHKTTAHDIMQSGSSQLNSVDLLNSKPTDHKTT